MQIYQYLKSEESQMEQVQVSSLKAAQEIEQAMFNQNGKSTGDSYKPKFRTLNFNLKDVKNGALRQRYPTSDAP